MMRVPASELRERDIVSVRRVLTARGKRSRLEACVKFVDVEARDRIASYARNLGEYIGDGKATATFRHDIPSHLTGVHKTLLHNGYSMAKKHGKGFKRNIRFDDSALTFCINVLLPGKDSKWITVSHERAYEDRREGEADLGREEDLSSGTKAILSNEQRPTPMDTNQRAATAAQYPPSTSSSSATTRAASNASMPASSPQQVWGADK